MFITLTFEDTPDEVEHAIRTLTQLKADRSQPNTSSGGPDISPDNDPAQQWWAALSKRIGSETRRMAEVTAQMSGFGAWQELADRLDVPPDTIRSWHRNVGRSIKRVNEELGTNYQLFGWNIALNRFAMADEVRTAILNSIGEDPYA
jgi:hypothetical protein